MVKTALFYMFITLAEAAVDGSELSWVGPGTGLWLGETSLAERGCL